MHNNYIFFDTKTSRLYKTDSATNRDTNDPSCFAIKKLSDLERVSSFEFVNLEDFTTANPCSRIEAYIAANHNEKVYTSFNKYIAAYAHLYRCYKSLAALTEHEFIDFIDEFIESCIRENTDHPATICYFGSEVHKILKLRKAVYKMFENNLREYEFYTKIAALQIDFKLTDNELRKIRKFSMESLELLIKKLTLETADDNRFYTRVYRKERRSVEELIAAA